MNATTTAPTESMFIDIGHAAIILANRLGQFEDIEDLTLYIKDKGQIHAAIGRCFDAYLSNIEKMPLNFWCKHVEAAFEKANRIVCDACDVLIFEDMDEQMTAHHASLEKQFIIKLDELTEYLTQ